MSVKEYQCWNYSAHWYLVEMHLDIPASKIEWDKFVIPERGVDPGNWQSPYMEQYLNEEGTERLCGSCETPGENADHCRVAFFLYKGSESVLQTPYGEFVLSDEKTAPERLRSCLEFEEENADMVTDGPVTVSYVVTKKLYCVWAIERSFSGFRAIISLALCLLGGAAFGMAFSAGFRPLFLVPAYFFLYYALLRDLRCAAKEYDRLAEEYGEDDWKTTISLEESGILWEDGTERSVYTYSDIRNAYEKKDKFCLVMRDGTILQLYKVSLQGCTTDACWNRIDRSMDAVNRK